ncbi:GntR family transcriptional regulator [Salinicola endophyticus]|uniref:GntR family transcriptional regulator n=1 Tax=Salinicola endophyticus TaxID=1949083 RepID=A0ABY8FJG2_9GAMM|nr:MULTISPECIES: GntR family transcriptional regulator [Salinicola]WFF41753.1 GntR family transcriptional regulator [Salinicola endophyticus]
MFSTDIAQIPARQTLWEQTAQRLQTLIANGTIAPGTRLTENALAQQLGVSRAPLREAIRHLMNIGLLISEPYKGVRVLELTPDGLHQLYEYRTGLEQMAFKGLWHKRTAASFDDLDQRHARLLEAIDAGDGALAIDRELALHQWCYELSGNPLLLDAWSRIKPHLQCYFVLHQRAHKRAGPARQSHDSYLEHAKGDSLEATLAYIARHMKQGFEQVIQTLG